MKVRKATEEDAKDIFIWRNDLVTVEMSESNALIDIDSHLVWMKNTLSDKTKFIYIGLIGDIKIGVIRFDLLRSRNGAELSINLNPLMRGKNYSSQFLHLAINFFAIKRNFFLIAKIKKINTSSIKCFLNAGFFLEHENEEYFFYKFIKD
jgi:RimJ/RimL family protein N-acetyltransferase